MAEISGYDEESKKKARRRALRHAVALVTTRRDEAALVPADHPRQILKAKKASWNPADVSVTSALDRSDLRNWERFRDSMVGRRHPRDIAVAYLAGPHPANDLVELLKLGIRPENIWAFENKTALAEIGLEELRSFARRGVKFLNLGIEKFFMTSPQRFDIIYLDACGSLPSEARMVSTLFRNSALSPLGVLVTNFSKPDVGNESHFESHARIVAAYLYPKSSMDRSKGGQTDGPEAYSFLLDQHDLMPPDDGSELDAPESARLFVDHVKKHFGHFYGSFLTRHIMDIAALIAPMARLAGSELWLQMSANRIDQVIGRGRSMLRDQGADFSGPGGEASDAMNLYSVLWSFGAVGAFGPTKTTGPVAEGQKDVVDRWMQALQGLPQGKLGGADLIAAYSALRCDASLQAPAIRSATTYDYSRMAHLCDVPSSEIGFFTSFAQLGYPAHCNARLARRYLYNAKKTDMYLDVLPFDECRYVYDWLSAPALMPHDWADQSAELTFRFALDAIAKSSWAFQSDFLYGCNAIGIDTKFPEGFLGRRLKIRS